LKILPSRKEKNQNDSELKVAIQKGKSLIKKHKHPLLAIKFDIQK